MRFRRLFRIRCCVRSRCLFRIRCCVRSRCLFRIRCCIRSRCLFRLRRCVRSRCLFRIRCCIRFRCCRRFCRSLCRLRWLCLCRRVRRVRCYRRVCRCGRCRYHPAPINLMHFAALLKIIGNHAANNVVSVCNCCAGCQNIPPDSRRIYLARIAKVPENSPCPGGILRSVRCAIRIHLGDGHLATVQNIDYHGLSTGICRRDNLALIILTLSKIRP